MGTITRNFANNILGTGEIDATDGVNGTIPATNVADASLNNVTSLPSSVGYAIKSVASDPPSLNAGEIFYNSTSGAFKALVNVEAWSSGGSLITDRRLLAGAGTQTAGLAVGGYGPALTTSETEEYNGSGWSTGGSLGTARYRLASAGTQTAGLAFGGELSAIKRNLTEEYDGSSWTAGGNLGTTRSLLGGAGIQTAGLAFGGFDGSPIGATEEYDGSAWTAGGSLSTSRNALTGSGTQDAALAFGGYDGSSTTGATEEYNGTAWTSGGSLNTARSYLAGCGTQTSTLGFAGGPSGPGGPRVAVTEFYDGSTWTTSPASLATARDQLAGSGTTSAGLAFGGREPTVSRATEEYNKSTNTITAAAYSSANNLNTARVLARGDGTTTAAIIAGGGVPPSPVNVFTSAKTAATEEYDGTNWSNGGNLSTARDSLIVFGTQTATVASQGIISEPNTFTTNTEEYNGTSWTAGGAAPGGAAYHDGCGSQTAGLGVGGYHPTPGIATTSYEYDGSTWTAGGGLVSPSGGGYNHAVTGTQTAAVGAPLGGTQSYDGTSWTVTLPSASTSARTNGGRWGSGDYQVQSAGGETRIFDGSSWFTGAAPGDTRTFIGMGAGTGGGNGLIASGSPGPTSYSNATEEFTVETITQVAKTLSSS